MKYAKEGKVMAFGLDYLQKNSVLNICLDLGGDSLKIAFACNEGDAPQWGKFVGFRNQMALPAVAYYDTEQEKWFFSEEIDEQNAESFVTVVKIKTLISLLTLPDRPVAASEKVSETEKRKLAAEWKRRLGVHEKNKRYYSSGALFPKFYFPEQKAVLFDFEKMVAQDRTFAARPTDTPCRVCEEFFRYVFRLVEKRKAELGKKLGCNFSSYRIALVHPAKVGDDYLTELSRLINVAFGVPPVKVVSSNKALAQYAYQRKAVSEEERFLVFDMGEESISVVQAMILNGQVSIDGVEGHSEPISIGGNHVDRALVTYMENKIEGRQTIGTPSAGTEGHIYEDSVASKQYLLMKNVKYDKVVLSRDAAHDDVFSNGVPLTFCREVLVQRLMTREDLAKSIGVRMNDGIAKQILDYVVEEINRPVNRKVTKVFFSGGLIETYALLDYLKSGLRQRGCYLSVCTFDDGVKKGDDFSILSHEDSVFAPAVGGAIVALQDINIRTVLSLSYATLAGFENDPTQFLSVFVNRGTVIPESGMTKMQSFTVGNGYEHWDAMYSFVVDEKELAKYKTTVRSAKCFVIGSIAGGRFRPRAEAWDAVGLKVVSGGVADGIYFMHAGRRIHVCKRIQIDEGIVIDKNGHIEPFIRMTPNHDNNRGRAVIRYWNPRTKAYDIPGEVNCYEIEPMLNMQAWDV